ncbi:MAG: hypothetical protein ACK5HR_00545 [Mycoplasmatales bacterium]
MNTKFKFIVFFIVLIVGILLLNTLRLNLKMKNAGEGHCNRFTHTCRADMFAYGDN